MGMGSSTTAVREIDVAFMPMHELRLSLPFQVQEMLPMPVDEAILDFYPGTQFDGPTGRMVQGTARRRDEARRERQRRRR